MKFSLKSQIFHYDRRKFSLNYQKRPILQNLVENRFKNESHFMAFDGKRRCEN